MYIFLLFSTFAKITLIIKLHKKNVKLSAIFLKTTEKSLQVNGQMNKDNVFIRNSKSQNLKISKPQKILKF